MRIYAGSDHAGFGLRKTVVERLRSQGKDVVDVGTDSQTACDYPEFAYAVASKVRAEPGTMGILVCATGQGMSMAAGKVRGIRAVAPSTIEAARLSRIDNNANVLCLAGRTLSEADALAMVDTWLATSFAGGRHARRIAKVAAIETASAVAFVTESERLRLAKRGFPRKLFERDPSLFSQPADIPDQITDGLAWVSLPQAMLDKVPDLNAFAEQIRTMRLKDVVFLLDGTESKESLCRAWGSAGMRMHVVRAGDSSSIPILEATARLDTLLVVVCSTSAQIDGDVQAQEQQLRSRMIDRCLGNAQKAGQHFAAITTPGSELARVAEMHRYGKVFLDETRARHGFDALGFVGLVPALLAGFDPARLLTRAKAMSDACRGERLEDNPGATLGVLLGAMVKHGRNTLTLLASRSLEPFANWLSFLLRGACPGIELAAEGATKTTYPPDRIFVHIQASDDPAAIPPEAMEALHLAGQPYIQLAVADRSDLGTEIFRWQMAATVAGIVLGKTSLDGGNESGHPTT